MKHQQLEFVKTSELSSSKYSDEEAKAQIYHAPELHELGNIEKVQGDWTGDWLDWQGWYTNYY